MTWNFHVWIYIKKLKIYNYELEKRIDKSLIFERSS